MFFQYKINFLLSFYLKQTTRILEKISRLSDSSGAQELEEFVKLYRRRSRVENSTRARNREWFFFFIYLSRIYIYTLHASSSPFRASIPSLQRPAHCVTYIYAFLYSLASHPARARNWIHLREVDLSTWFPLSQIPPILLLLLLYVLLPRKLAHSRDNDPLFSLLLAPPPLLVKLIVSGFGGGGRGRIDFKQIARRTMKFLRRVFYFIFWGNFANTR